MNDNEIIKYGKMAFEAYCAVQENKTFDGREIPGWDKLPPKIQEAWCVASNMVIHDYTHECLRKVKWFQELSDKGAQMSADKHFGDLGIEKLLKEVEIKQLADTTCKY